MIFKNIKSDELKWRIISYDIWIIINKKNMEIENDQFKSNWIFMRHAK